MERIIMHIDVNNAFLSWTAVDLLNKGYKVDIRKEVSVIGGDETKRRGIVLAKSIPAKNCLCQNPYFLEICSRRWRQGLLARKEEAWD